MSIRTLVADDSRAFRETIAAVLRADPGFEVVGLARDGHEAVALAHSARPDLIVMDVMMPGLGGLAATAQIMSSAPCVVVIMSTLMDTEAQRLAFDAMEVGAVDVTAKPRDLGAPATQNALRALLRALAEVKVVRRWSTGAGTDPAEGRGGWLVLGASTGGPPAVREVLRHLPADWQPPVAVAQHLASGFAVGLRRWLEESLGRPVVVVDAPQPARPGAVHLAADDHDLRIEDNLVIPIRADGRAAAPSVDCLFESLVQSTANVVAVLLTGMGTDGARGLRRLRDAGHHTIAQDEETSLVYGMPRAAAEAGAALEQLSLPAIGPRVAKLLEGVAAPRRIRSAGSGSGRDGSRESGRDMNAPPASRVNGR